MLRAVGEGGEDKDREVKDRESQKKETWWQIKK